MTSPLPSGPPGPSALAAATAKPTDRLSDLRVGVVTVAGTPVTLNVAGGVVRARRLASYTAVVGHTVAVVQTGEYWLIIGQIV